MPGTSAMARPDELGEHRRERRLHHPQVTGGPLATDQRRPQQRRLAHHLQIVREADNACQHRVEQRLRRRPFRQRVGQPLQMGLVVTEQHRFLGRKVPEEGAFGDAGLHGELRHRHVGEPVLGEPCQRHPPQRLVGGSAMLLRAG